MRSPPPPNYYCNVAHPAGEERERLEEGDGSRRENGRSARAARIRSVGDTWLLVLIVYEGPTHMLSMHNVKESSSAQVAGMGALCIAWAQPRPMRVSPSLLQPPHTHTTNSILLHTPRLPTFSSSLSTHSTPAEDFLIWRTEAAVAGSWQGG